MYGMIHRAARQMVLDQFGADTWKSITDKMRLDDSHFIGSVVYDDKVAMDLVANIAQRAGIDRADALEAFGEYWIKYASESSFHNVMRMAGANLLEFLGNLDRMHSSVQVTFIDAKLPTFEVVSSTPSEIHLVYRSPRQGLERFVKGLMQGLLQHFGKQGRVELKPREDTGLDVMIRMG